MVLVVVIHMVRNPTNYLAYVAIRVAGIVVNVRSFSACTANITINIAFIGICMDNIFPRSRTDIAVFVTSVVVDVVRHFA